MRLIVTFVIAAMLALAPGLRAQETPAQEVVQSLHDALLDVMQAADALGFDGRRDYLGPVMDEVFDMAVIARASAGRHWRKAEDEEKQRLVDVVTRLSVSTYAARFDGFSGESFRILAEEPARAHEVRPGYLEIRESSPGGPKRILSLLALTT